MTRGGRIAERNEKSNCGGRYRSFFQLEGKNATVVVRPHLSAREGRIPPPNKAGKASPHARDTRRRYSRLRSPAFPAYFGAPLERLIDFPVFRSLR